MKIYYHNTIREQLDYIIDNQRENRKIKHITLTEEEYTAFVMSDCEVVPSPTYRFINMEGTTYRGISITVERDDESSSK